MSSLKVLSLAIAAMLFSNSALCMENEDIKYPSDLHPKELRKKFEKNKWADILNKKSTKKTLKADPAYYQEKLNNQREKLAKKSDRMPNIALKKSAWGTAHTVLGSIGVGMGCFWLYAIAFESAFTNRPRDNWEANWAFVLGSAATIGGSKFMWRGCKKIWNNYSTTRVKARFDRHMEADEDVEDYLNDVFNTKESDVYTRRGRRGEHFREESEEEWMP